jgi:hypothetical protein
MTLFDSVITIRRNKMAQSPVGFQNFKEFVPQIGDPLINVALTMFDRLYYAFWEPIIERQQRECEPPIEN